VSAKRARSSAPESSPISRTRRVLRLRSGFRLGARPFGKLRVTPAKRLKLSPAGPMVLHAKGVRGVDRCRPFRFVLGLYSLNITAQRLRAGLEASRHRRAEEIVVVVWLHRVRKRVALVELIGELDIIQPSCWPRLPSTIASSCEESSPYPSFRYSSTLDTVEISGDGYRRCASVSSLISRILGCRCLPRHRTVLRLNRVCRSSLMRRRQPENGLGQGHLRFDQELDGRRCQV